MNFLKKLLPYLAGFLFIPTIVFGAGAVSSVFRDTLGFIRPLLTTDGFIANGSSTLASLSSTISTSTNATSTNLFATNFKSTNGTTSVFAITGAAANCSGTNALTTLASGAVVCTTITGTGGAAYSFTPGVFGSGNIPVSATSTSIHLLNAGLFVSTSSDPIANLGGGNIGSNGNWPVVIQNPNTVVGSSTGIAFMVSATLGQGVGAGLGFVRTGASAIGDLFFATQGSNNNNVTERLRITSTGNVGIGTTSPYAKFAIHASSTDTNLFMFAISSSTLGTATTTLFTISNIGLVSYLSQSGNNFISTNATNTNATSTNLFSTNALVSNLFVVNSTTTNATTTNLAITGGAANCGGTNALTTNTIGAVTCTAQPQGTVTAVNGTANQIDSSGGATPTLSLSNHVIFPASFQALRGTTTNATSTNLSVIGSSTVGTTFNVGSAIQDNGSLVVNGQTTLASSLSGLALLTSGVVSAYGGAAACTNQFVTAISSVGGTTCATLTGAAFGTVSANTWFGNPTGVAATPGFNATSTLFTGTAGQNAYFNGTGLLVGTSSLFVNTSTGNIGIDDTTPDFNLEIATANSNGYFGVTNVNDGDVFMIANSSNIGVGTTTPGYLLELASSSASQLVLSDGSISSTQWGFRNTGGTLYIGTSSPATYATSTVSAIQINSTGNPQVSIGSSSPQAMLSLHLGSTTLFANNNAILVGSTSASNNATTTLFQLSNTGWAYFPNAQGSGANQTGYWCYDATGQLIRDTTVCLVSALKFKKDINPLTLGLDTVMAMKPVTYYLKQSFSKEDAGQHIGFVADWSESVVPDLVTHDSNGDVHGFDYQAYTAVLTKAMQELNNKVNDLKIGRITRTAEENWQWLAIGLLVAWNIWLTLRKKK